MTIIEKLTYDSIKNLHLIKCQWTDLKPDDIVEIEYNHIYQNLNGQYWFSENLYFLYENDKMYKFYNINHNYVDIYKNHLIYYKLLGRYISKDELKLLKLNILLE